MRNCFVPNCDAHCKQKSITKRMMFSAPKEIFGEWKKVLFSKREFRETDRVCERHFHENQILTHWDHVINGQIFRLEREKPKIDPSAVPSLHLPDRQTALAPATGIKRRTRNSKRKSQNTSKDETEPLDDIDGLIEVEVLDEIDIEEEIKKEDLTELKRQRFMQIYNDIANIELPCSLWGVHRDSHNYRYIAFTKFDDDHMQCAKVLRITDTLQMDVRVDGVSKSMGHLDELSIDIIADAIRNLDEDNNE